MERPIGIFDSGVGGLTVFHAVERALPEESLVYLGDTARVPYGTKSAETVRRYAVEATEFLVAHEVKLVVVACNSASSVALEALADAPVPVLGVIGPGARQAAARSRTGRIGVIGTRATVASGAYERAIRRERPDAEVVARACPLFVPLAEEGWTANAIARATAHEYLDPLRDVGIDTLVLGCTHYPLLRDTIAETLPGVELVDSAESVAAEVADRLRRAGVARATGGARAEHRFFVTDSPEPFRAVAERFLGRAVDRLETARIAHD